MSEVPPSRWHPAAAVAAWLLPGLGHVLLGQPRRGAFIAVGIIGLWSLGLVIGGLSVISRDAHPLWFLGQLLLAPSVIVDALGGYFRHAGLLAESFGRPAEHGLLYTTLAGMLNLMAVVDALYRDPVEPRHRPETAPGRGARP